MTGRPRRGAGLLRAVVNAASLRPRTTLALVVACLFPALFAVAGLRPENNLADWLLEDDPTLLRYQAFLAEYGNDEAVVIAYRAPGDVLAPEEAALQARLAERLGAVEGVEEVQAPALIGGEPSPQARAALRRSGLLSPDGRTATVVVRMAAHPDAEALRSGILREVDRAIAEILTPAGRPAHLAGKGVLYEAINRQTMRESGIFFTLALAVMVLLLRVSLLRWRAVGIALAAPFATGVATLGLLAAADRPLSMVTAILPTLVLVIGLGDAIHIISHYYTAYRAAPPISDQERRRLVVRSVTTMALPCFLTSLTTGLGLLALSTSRMTVVRDLGLFAALGVGLAWIFATLVCAAGLSLWAVTPPRAEAHDGIVDRALAWLAERLPRWKGRVLAAGMGLTLVLLAGSGRISVDTQTLAHLPEGHVIREDSEWIERNAGFYTPLEFVVETGPNGGAASPAFLGRVDAWRQQLEADPEVGRTLGASDAPGGYLAADERSTRVTAYLPMMSARGFARVAERLQRDGERTLGPEAAVRVAGYLPLYVRSIDYVVESTLWGFGLAFAIVFLVMGIALRSVGLLAAAVPVNLLPVVLVFGVMGWGGIPLDIAVATIGAVVIGISVDDSIHFLWAYRRARATGHTTEAAISAAVRGAGRGMVLSSVVLAVGFAVLMAAGSVSIVYFGLLAATAIVGALAADLLILPALLLSRSSA